MYLDPRTSTRPWPSDGNGRSFDTTIVTTPTHTLWISTPVLTTGVSNRALEPPPPPRLARLALARSRSRAAVQDRRGQSPAPLPKALYARPRRVGRACGGRHRVMLP